MHKTASSSCQHLFEDSRALLAAEGLHYFKSYDANHSFFLMSFFEAQQRDIGRLIAARHADPRYAREREALWRDWLGFLADTGRSGDDALVSAELGGFLEKPATIRLRDQVLARFDRMVVLMLIRPPLSFARSAALQRLKGSHSLEALAMGLPRPGYRRRLETYEKLLGAGNIRLELFHPERMVAGDPAQTLLAMMGKAGQAVAGLRAPRINEALSRTGAKLLSALQVIRRDPNAESRLPSMLRDALLTLPRAPFDYRLLLSGAYADRPLPPAWTNLAQAIPGDRFTLPAEVQNAITRALREDVEWASARLGADIWAYDTPRDPDAPTLAELTHIDDADAKAIVRHLAGGGPTANAANTPLHSLARMADC